MKRRRRFWKWLVIWTRAVAIEEARKKRVLQEIQEWNMLNGSLDESDSLWNDDTSSDESSTVGSYGSDCGDGDCGDGCAF